MTNDLCATVVRSFTTAAGHTLMRALSTISVLNARRNYKVGHMLKALKYDGDYGSSR